MICCSINKIKNEKEYIRVICGQSFKRIKFKEENIDVGIASMVKTVR